MACGSFGLPLIAQGTNNIYENGYYLLFRKDKSGSVRNAYRYTAKALGYSQDTADTIYGTVDLSLSGYGIIRKTLKPDAWRLYRYINSDFIRGWQEMGRTGLTIEVISDLTTGSGMYELIRTTKENDSRRHAINLLIWILTFLFLIVTHHFSGFILLKNYRLANTIIHSLFSTVSLWFSWVSYSSQPLHTGMIFLISSTH